jgi:hypothetical protein
MISEHLVWWGLTVGGGVWYCAITVCVAVCGTANIRHWLRDLYACDAAGESRGPTATHRGGRELRPAFRDNPPTTKETP